MQNIFSLSGKIAFITGGAGLLGKRHAEAIIEAGGKAVIADCNFSAAEEVCAELNKKYGNEHDTCAWPIFVDVTNKATIERAANEYKQIDILINNAAKDPKIDDDGGLSPGNRFETMTEEFWHAGTEAILTGTVLCSQVISNKMLENGGGVIINIASDLAVIAPDQRIYKKPGLDDHQQNVKPITYSAAKWGVIGMTKYLATYFADRNIRVNSLSPGAVFGDEPDEFVNKLTNLIPMGRMAHVDEYKGAIVFLCSEASSYMTGENLVIDGGRATW